MWAILATLFCCLPLGIVSIVFAAQVDTKWNRGDWNGAVESSGRARMWLIVSVVASVVVIIGYFLFIVLVIGASTATTGTG